MKVEAVLSVRAELPENVRRTVASLRAAGVDSVRVVEDDPPMGCGYRRDEMICASTADAVFICDGHMAFSPGYFDYLREHLTVNPTSLSCTRMTSLRHDWTPSGDRYCGAEIFAKPFCGALQFPIAAKWRKDVPGDGRIGAVMGACYGMTKDWYYGMGRPLSILRAWGLDEEALSIASWLCGGTVNLIPGEASHIYAAPHTRSGRSDQELGAIFGNHLALLAALPMSDAERIDLAGVMTPIMDLRMESHEETTIKWRTEPVWANSGGYIKRLVNDSLDDRRRDIERLADALVDGPWGWEAYRDSMVKTQTEEDMKKERIIGKAKATADVGRRIVPVKAKSDSVACRHCGARGKHRLLGVYPNGSRRFICAVCERPFIVTGGG